MIKRFGVLLLLTLLVLSLMLTGCSGAEKTSSTTNEEVKKYEWKFNVSVAEESSWTRGAKKFAELVSEKTNGNITINVYPNEQLSGGNMTKAVDMARAGTFEIDLRSTLAWSSAEQKLGALSLPFLFTSYEEVDEVLSGDVGTMIGEIMERNNLKLLAFGENGYRQLTTKGIRVSSPEDMKGLKVRVPTSPVLVDTFKTLSADPTVIDFAELYMALQVGTIDGQENPLGLILTSKLYEVQDYLTMWNYCYDPLLFTIHKNVWESLSPEYQEIVESCAKEAMEWQVKINREENDAILKQLEDSGLEVIYPSEQEIEKFKEITKPVYKRMEDAFGKELIEALQK